MNNCVNSYEMKKINREVVLRYIREGKYSRADLSKKTKLTRATVTNIVNELLENKVVKEGDVMSDGKVGRNSTALSIDSSKGYVIGVNISRIGVSISVCDYGCNVVEESFVQFDVGNDRARALEFIENQVERYFRVYNKERFLGMGISVPGPVHAEKGQIFKPSQFNDWWGFNPKNYFENLYGLKVFVANNATTFVVHEHIYGNVKNFDNFIGLVIDSGVGGCAIINNEVYYGASGIGLEIGHICLDMNGEQCSCGSTGCSELYIATHNILKFAQTLNPDFTSWNKVVDAAENGDADAWTVIERQAKYLSYLLVSIANSWDVLIFYICGDFCYKPKYLHECISKRIGKSIAWHGDAEIKIMFAETANTTSSAAAANLALLKVEVV